MSDWPELSKLAEAIALGDGFAFYVLIAPSPEAAAEALSALQKEIEQGAGAAYAVESIRPLLAAEAPKAETEAALMALLSPRADARYVVLDLSDTRDFSEGPLGHLFFRLNEQRNRLVAQVNRPLILVIPPFAERLLQDTAQDLWSIRSLPALVLPVSEPTPAQPIAESLPVYPPDGVYPATVPVRPGNKPVSMLIVAPERDMPYVRSLEQRLSGWIDDGVISLRRITPSGLVDQVTMQRAIGQADVVLLMGLDESDWPASVPFFVESFPSWVLPQQPLILIGLERWRRRWWPELIAIESVAPRFAVLAISFVLQSRRNKRDPWASTAEVVREAVDWCRTHRGIRPLGAVPLPTMGADNEPVTPAMIRKLLYARLRTSADFDAFCYDHFPDVYRRFSGGMPPASKENLLLELVEPVQILRALQNR